MSKNFILMIANDVLIDALRFFTRQILARFERINFKLSYIVQTHFPEAPYHPLNTSMCFISLTKITLFVPIKSSSSTEVGKNPVIFLFQLQLKIDKF